jgi:hypothetical protein
MVRRLALCAALCSIAPVQAEVRDRIDWDRGIIKAMGRGAPDLNAPSIAVARAAAERAALAAAQRNALRVLQDATLDDGSRVESLLRDDTALRNRVESKLRGVRASRTRWFTDGGVWLDVEVPFGILPPRIAQHLRPPDLAPDAGVVPEASALHLAPDGGAADSAPDGGAQEGDGGGRPR